MKKTAFFLLLIMLFTAFSHVCAEGGSCGENASWTLSDDGLLTVSGTGPMEDYDYADRVPWYGMRNQIKRVIIEEGITTVGKDSFLSCINLLDLNLLLIYMS